jgi:hypothetical protein
MLRDVDRQFLTNEGYTFAEYPHGGMTLLVLSDYPLPAGYEPATADVLLQIPSSYPDGNIDMWWVYPHVVFASTNAEPARTEVKETFASFAPDPSRSWQRFSRHPTWRAGVDDLRSFLRVMRRTFETEAQQVAV